METSKEEILAEIARLNLENAELKRENADLEMMLDMHSEHSDHVEDDLLNKIESTLRESEKRFRVITETIPVPIIISQIPGSLIVYANNPAGSLLGLSVEKLMECRATDFYNANDRDALAEAISAKGYVRNYELQGIRADGKRFWVALFIQALSFNDAPCLLTVLYDITDRKIAEEEIRDLKERLEQRVKEREGKYLTFSLADESYGISLLKVKEIIGMMPITHVPGMANFIKGVINLRGRVIPVINLRLRFGLPEIENSGRTCIIVLDITGEKNTLTAGIIVDTVSEVLHIRGEHVDDSPDFGIRLETDYILGMAKTDNSVKILIDADKILNIDEHLNFFQKT